jgi:hypothetical protein
MPSRFQQKFTALSKRCGFQLREMPGISRSKNSIEFLLHNVLLAMHTPSPHRTCGFQLHTFWQRGQHHFSGETHNVVVFHNVLHSDALPIIGSAHIPRHCRGNRKSPKRRTPYIVRECTHSQSVAASEAYNACTRSTLFYMRGVI